MDFTQLITIESGKRSGQPCIRDMRITVRDVLEYLAGGMTVDELLDDFPELTRADVRACMAFAASQISRSEAAQQVENHSVEDVRLKLQIDGFLDNVYMLSKIGDDDSAGIEIFDFLDRLLADGNFGPCNDLLAKVDINLLDTKVMRSLLSVTAPAKKHLPARALLFERIEKRMIELRGELKTHIIIGPLA